MQSLDVDLELGVFLETLAASLEIIQTDESCGGWYGWLHSERLFDHPTQVLKITNAVNVDKTLKLFFKWLVRKLTVVPDLIKLGSYVLHSLLVLCKVTGGCLHTSLCGHNTSNEVVEQLVDHVLLVEHLWVMEEH